MRLNRSLVTSFNYDGKTYDIDLAFDTVLTVFDVLDDERLMDLEKAQICLNLLLKDQGYDQSKTIDLWNYIYESFIHVEAEKSVEYDLEGNPMPVQDDDGSDVKALDLEEDAEYIYASFRQAYGINLYEERGKMHWNEFQALLNGLPEDTIMQKIISIRLWKPSKHDDSEYKKSMRKLQKKYALKDEEFEEVDETYG